jgi:hypothetical protein
MVGVVDDRVTKLPRGEHIEVRRAAALAYAPP